MHEGHEETEPLPAATERVGRAVLNAAFAVQKALGPGLLESVYEACLAEELQQAGLAVERPTQPADQLVQRARLLSAETLERAAVLVPATPGIKRLQAILYTQLQRAMLGELSSDRALAEAEVQWNRYAQARWP